MVIAGEGRVSRELDAGFLVGKEEYQVGILDGWFLVGKEGYQAVDGFWMIGIKGKVSSGRSVECSISCNERSLS